MSGGLTGAEEESDDNLNDEGGPPKTKPAEPVVLALLPVFVEGGKDCVSRLPRKGPLGAENTFVVDGSFGSALKIPDRFTLGALFSVAVSVAAPEGCALDPNWKGVKLLLPPRDATLKVGKLAKTELAAVLVTIVVVSGFGDAMLKVGKLAKTELAAVLVTIVVVSGFGGGLGSAAVGAFCCVREGVALKSNPLGPAGCTPAGLTVMPGLADSKGLLPRVSGFAPILKLKPELDWEVLVVMSEGEEVMVGVLYSNFDVSDFVAATLSVGAVVANGIGPPILGPGSPLPGAWILVRLLKGTVRLSVLSETSEGEDRKACGARPRDSCCDDGVGAVPMEPSGGEDWKACGARPRDSC